jgi:DNA polymerase I-like protein with 3'-5' exonuclease and polymerase domains/intein/homing endonuclease
MTKWCSCCEQWSALPVDARPDDVACEHCGAPLDAGHRYVLCRECGHHHRMGYEVCPNRVEENVPVALFGGEDAYTVVPKKRRTRRGDEYYWQLYMDYGDKPATGDADMEEPPHPALAFENGNGHAPAEGNGTAKSYAGNGSNGNGHGGSHNAIDLAIMDSAPMTLFSEDGPGASLIADAAPVKVSAGNYNDFDYELINDPSRLAVVAEMLARETVLGIDTETTGLDPHTSELLLLQISTADKVYIVDCKRLVPLALKPLLENSHVLKVAQNAKFEYEMLRQQAGITLSGLFDTMLAERLVMAGIGREISLKAIAQKYIGAVLDKSVRESFYKTASIGDAYLAPEQLHYAARDAFIMLPIWRDQMRELKKHGLEQVADLEFRCIAAVGDMELAGVKIDEARWRKIIEDVAVQRDRSASELADMLQAASMQATMFGVSAINLNSNTQLLDVFSKLGVDLPDTMEATLVKYDHPAIKKLLEYRGFEKTLSAFGENVLSLINPKTGRIHPDFNQYGADTGRFSCTKPNVQQIPATSDFRKCFVAAPGYKLVTCVAEGTRVATERGLIPIEATQAGDRVIQEDGSARLVQRVINQGLRETVILRTAMGYELTVTPEHRIRVLSAEGDYMWREVRNLQAEDKVAIKLRTRANLPDESLTLLDVRNKHFNATNRSMPATVSEELALLMGYITGDGTFQHDYVGMVVSDKDADVAEWLAAICKRLLGYDAKRYSYRGVIELRIFSKQIKEWLQQNSSAKNHVPGFLWTAPTEIVTAYLRGLFEADGSVQPGAMGRVSFSTIHEQLAREVQQLLATVGVAARRHKTEHGKGCGFIWIVTIPAAWKRRFQETVGFISTRKKQTLAGIVAIASHGNGHGGIPNMARKAGRLLAQKSVPREVTGVLRNVSQQGTRISIGTATLLRDSYPDVYNSLGIASFVSHSLLFDSIVSIESSGRVQVYDLTVKDTSTFIAGGFVNHNCDYSQCELRVLAELSGDEGFVGAFISGQDLHTLTASQMFGVPLEEVQKPQRSAAKAINFGLAYGMGPGGLAPRLGVSLDEAKDLISKYFKAYPGVQKWLDKAAKDSVRLGYSSTTIGRKRFYNLPDESLKRFNEDDWRKQIAAIERQGKNSPIQGANADMTKLALIYLRSALKDWDARTVNTVHDEIVVEVREDQAEEVKHIVEREMVRAGQAILKVVPIVAEASLADYWSK